MLQTLALIQRQSDQPREVLRLARGQERELRHWLYGPGGYGRPGASSPARVSPRRSRRRAAEVEDTYAIDGATRRRSATARWTTTCAPSSSAAREAMVNAAKHAEVDEVSVYAEVEADAVHVFVRDRGVGFDPDAVPDDRHGLADSDARPRWTRHGGTVRLRSTPGEGTEVHLSMPVSTPQEAAP